MKLRSSQALFAHWDSVRQDRECPERAEISPAALKGALTDTFVLAFDASAGHPFRLAGTQICALFGREVRREPFVSLWAEVEQASAAELAASVADDTSGLLAGVTGRNGEGQTLSLELLLLPLRHRGRTHRRLIGTLAAAERPYWLALRPITALVLESHRFLSARTRAPAPLVRIPPDRVRHGLGVYDGGQIA
jgi:hypothetical protein